MSNVFHTSLLALLQRIYKPIYIWAKANLATKTELSQNEAEHFHPVDMDSLTPSSTFGKNSVIGINGVLYRSLRQTSHFPVTLTTQNGAFVVNTVNGRKAFVIADSTLNADWEVWTDAAIEYWIQSLNTRLSTLEAVTPVRTYTSNGNTYTAEQLLEAVASMMDKRIVYQPE